MPRRQRPTIEFSAIQLATLAACVLGASTVVFLFGIYVGRGLSAHHAGVDDQVARIPVAGPPDVVVVARGLITPAPREPSAEDALVAPPLVVDPPPAAEPAWRTAIELWLRWNTAQEKVTAFMFSHGHDRQQVEDLLDQVEQLRHRAVKLSEQLIGS